MHALQWIGAALAAMLLASCIYIGGPYRPPPDDETRLLYEIRVTAPGTRSQGWRGVLYDSGGAAVALRDGQRLDTPAGTFVGVRCQHLWSTCGAIHEDMLRWMERHDHNIIMGRDGWTYRLYARGYYGDRLTGELLRNGRAVAGAVMETPMGPYRWTDDRTRASGRHGWFHVSWR
jgi:hypothetical protein